MNGKKRILVVDDDPAIVEFIVMTLQSGPYELESACDGVEALEKASAFLPDLVILDLMMPRMHGFEVCQRLRSDGKHEGVKILVTSAKAYSVDVDNAKEAGADAYLTKPYAAKGLLEKVEGLLGAPAASAASKTGSAESPAPVPAPLPPVVPARSGDPFVVRFWGVRGSSPAPGPHTVRYGGNTACVELRLGDLLLVIDCGTGLRELGNALLAEFRDRAILGHVFVGHTHWDHIQGFPFFTPFYVPRNEFFVYSIRAAGKSLERVFRGQMAADYFPVPLDNLSSQLRFVEMEGPVDLGALKVSYHHLNHPGITIGFRFQTQSGKTVCYLSDHEPFGRLNAPSEATRRQEQGIVDFVRDSDLLICEAQYTEEEYRSRKGWGHSTFDEVVARAIASGSRRLALFHHDPGHTDEMMDGFVEHCRALIAKAGSPLECFAAREGQTLSL